jgi:HD-GYP domain-containing protein (c-di-GMP phosphodiesterase class II)
VSPAHRRSPPPAVCRGSACARRIREEAQRSTVRALLQALELKDPYTRAHSERVGELASLVARELGAPGARVDAVQLGGTLHDIGKLGVPTGLLRKSGPLTAEERRIVQLHPADGDGVLRGVHVLAEARAAVLHHHERVDGTGYPYGLSGGRIPEAARIVAVADAFDAMTSTRSYRPARPASAAIDELRRCAGTQFDPVMVAALVRALAQVAWRPLEVPPDGLSDVPLGGLSDGSAEGSELLPTLPPALCGATAAVEGPLLARVPAHLPTWAWLDAGANGKEVR